VGRENYILLSYKALGNGLARLAQTVLTSRLGQRRQRPVYGMSAQRPSLQAS